MPPNAQSYLQPGYIQAKQHQNVLNWIHLLNVCKTQIKLFYVMIKKTCIIIQHTSLCLFCKDMALLSYFASDWLLSTQTEQTSVIVTQGWPNYGPRAAYGRPTSLFRPAKYLADFFQAPRFRLWTAVQQHWLLPVSCWFVCRSST